MNLKRIWLKKFKKDEEKKKINKYEKSHYANQIQDLLVPVKDNNIALNSLSSDF